MNLFTKILKLFKIKNQSENETQRKVALAMANRIKLDAKRHRKKHSEDTSS